MDSRLILAYNLGPEISSNNLKNSELEGDFEFQCGFFIRNDLLDFFNSYKLFNIVTRNWNPVIVNPDFHYYTNHYKDYSKLILIPEPIALQEVYTDELYKIIDIDIVEKYKNLYLQLIKP